MKRVSERTENEPAAEWVALDALKPWAKNPRENAKAIAKIAASIKRFGFGAPIVARKADGEIIAGHTRYEAAKKLGLDRVPVRYLDLDPADAHLLALADNRLGEFAAWDSKGEKHRWHGGRAQTTTWDVSRVKQADYMHPMQKPLELYAIPMRNHTAEGDVVAEPFSGSGSQLIAAEQIGRRCFAMELEPKYVAVALERLAALGLTPKLCHAPQS